MVEVFHIGRLVFKIQTGFHRNSIEDIFGIKKVSLEFSVPFMQELNQSAFFRLLIDKGLDFYFWFRL